MAVSLINGREMRESTENQTVNQWKIPIYHLRCYQVHPTKVWFQLTTLVLTGAGCTIRYRCKFNNMTGATV